MKVAVVGSGLISLGAAGDRYLRPRLHPRRTGWPRLTVTASVATRKPLADLGDMDGLFSDHVLEVSRHSRHAAVPLLPKVPKDSNLASPPSKQKRFVRGSESWQSRLRMSEVPVSPRNIVGRIQFGAGEHSTPEAVSLAVSSAARLVYRPQSTYSGIIPIVLIHFSTNSGHPVIGNFVRRSPNAWPP